MVMEVPCRGVQLLSVLGQIDFYFRHTHTVPNKTNVPVTSRPNTDTLFFLDLFSCNPKRHSLLSIIILPTRFNTRRQQTMEKKSLYTYFLQYENPISLHLPFYLTLSVLFSVLPFLPLVLAFLSQRFIIYFYPHSPLLSSLFFILAFLSLRFITYLYLYPPSTSMFPLFYSFFFPTLHHQSIFPPFYIPSFIPTSFPYVSSPYLPFPPSTFPLFYSPFPPLPAPHQA